MEQPVGDSVNLVHWACVEDELTWETEVRLAPNGQFKNAAGVAIYHPSRLWHTFSIGVEFGHLETAFWNNSSFDDAITEPEREMCVHTTDVT